MSSATTYDVCVIGAGVVGSSTARYLASSGARTLLLEQVSYFLLFVDLLHIHPLSRLLDAFNVHLGKISTQPHALIMYTFCDSNLTRARRLLCVGL